MSERIAGCADSLTFFKIQIDDWIELNLMVQLNHSRLT